MTLKEIFVSNWKLPTLSQEETEKEKIKSDLIKGFKQLSARMESIEILISNTQLEDAKILLFHLSYDLINFYQKCIKGKTFGLGDDTSSFSIPDSPIKIKPFQYLNELNKLSSLDEQELDKYFEECLHTLDFITFYFKKQIIGNYKTTLDQFKFIRQIRVSVIGLVVLFSISSVLYYQFKFPKLKQQNVELYPFLDKEHPQTVESMKLTLPLVQENLGDWVEYQFSIPETMEQFGGIRIDPLEQRGIRFAIEGFQILDDKKSVVYSRKLILDQSLLPENYQDFLAIIDIKTAGKQQPGEIVEMITTGNNPQIHLVFPMVKNAKTIKLKMKYIEAHKVKKK
ncbi:hypothetical protein AB3N60_05650 [Leptospira sp. WS39.C2]